MDDTYLQQYLTLAPVPLGLIRAIDCRHIGRVPLGGKILDAGCGDGLLARILFKNTEGKVITGIDHDPGELKKARSLGIYHDLIACEITAIPFKNNTFDHVLSNSVLEHVTDIDQALAELARVLKPGGTLVFTVPSEYLSEHFLFGRIFRLIGFKQLSVMYARLKHRIWHHEHIDSMDIWTRRLQENNFDILDRKYIHPRSVTEICDLFTFSGACSMLWRKLFGRLLLFPSSLRGKVMARWFKIYYVMDEETGSTLFFVARKK